MESPLPSLTAPGDTVAAAALSVDNLIASVSASFDPAVEAFHRIPGSAIVLRYIKSSYQDDPIRSLVELFLFLFVVRYLLSPKYSTSRKSTSDELTEAEIDELIQEWTPEPLAAPLTKLEQADLSSVPVLAR